MGYIRLIFYVLITMSNLHAFSPLPNAIHNQLINASKGLAKHSLFFKRGDVESSTNMQQSKKRRLITKEERTAKSLKFANLVLENDGIDFDTAFKSHRISSGPNKKRNRKNAEAKAESQRGQSPQRPQSPTTQKMHEFKQLISQDPSSPKTRQKLDELDHWLNEPLTPSPHQHTHFGHTDSPPSPTTQKMKEFQDLINPPHSSKNSQSLAQSSSHSTNLSFQSQDSILKPFTKDVIRKEARKNHPPGYNSNKNIILLAAETSVKKGKTTSIDEAIKIGKEKLEQKKANDRNKMKNLRDLAKKDPETVGKIKQKIPKSFPKHLYISTRTHQLMFRGEAKSIEDAHKLASAESQAIRKADRERQARNYKYQRKVNRPEKGNTHKS